MCSFNFSVNVPIIIIRGLEFDFIANLNDLYIHFIINIVSMLWRVAKKKCFRSHCNLFVCWILCLPSLCLNILHFELKLCRFTIRDLKNLFCVMEMCVYKCVFLFKEQLIYPIYALNGNPPVSYTSPTLVSLIPTYS